MNIITRTILACSLITCCYGSGNGNSGSSSSAPLGLRINDDTRDRSDTSYTTTIPRDPYVTGGDSVRAGTNTLNATGKRQPLAWYRDVGYYHSTMGADRSYMPREGTKISKIPAEARPTIINGKKYFYHHGNFYRRSLFGTPSIAYPQGRFEIVISGRSPYRLKDGKVYAAMITEKGNGLIDVTWEEVSVPRLNLLILPQEAVSVWKNNRQLFLISGLCFAPTRDGYRNVTQQESS